MDAGPVIWQEDDIAPPDLGPLIEPDPVTFSFDAPGWMVLFALVGLGLLLLLVYLIRRYRQRAYRRAALQQLQQLQQRPYNPTQLIYQVNRLLKSVAMITYGREEVAGLTGQQWTAFLEETGMADGAADPLLVHYQANGRGDGLDLDQLLLVVKNWIQRHA